MCDECTDSSNREQVVICIRWINDELEPHEDFIGLYMVDDIRANTVVAVIKDTLLRINLSLTKCGAQCYDGASTMSGAKTGVAKQLSDEERRAIYIHCDGHALNLATGDSVKKSKLMKDALDTTFEVSKLIKYSPNRDVKFGKLKENLAPGNPGFRVLCPRWTVRADTLKSVLDNYTVLQQLWEESKNETADPSIRARIIGVEAQFRSFKYLFGVYLGHLLLRHTDNLSKTLQSTTMSASEGQKIASMTVATLETLRDEDGQFDLLWKKVEIHALSLDVESPKLPRKRKVPLRYAEGTLEPDIYDDCRHYFF